MTAPFCVMVLGLCLPVIGTPVEVLRKNGFHQVNAEREPLPKSRTDGDVLTFAAIKKSKAGKRAWIGVVVKEDRVSLVAVSCLSGDPAQCDLRQLLNTKGCEERSAKVSCRISGAAFTAYQCGRWGYIISDSEDGEAIKSCDLLKGSSSATAE